jgi:hypothetical protein
MKHLDSTRLHRNSFFRIVHFFAVFGMVHSTLVLPAKGIIGAYLNINAYYNIDNLSHDNPLLHDFKNRILHPTKKTFSSKKHKFSKAGDRVKKPEKTITSSTESFLTVSRFYKSFASHSRLEMDGASITFADSSIATDMEISISKLSKTDIAPLAPGMINVTRNGRAFRFFPDGTKFNRPVKITIGYDTTLIPAGYGPKDIKTYFYNTKVKRWEPLLTDTIDKTTLAVVSSTNHFTDYINGIIQVPESPQSGAFTSTMMNEIKAADPAANITLISPPDASQTGEANVSYPIKIPAGRKGMQPQLSLQYNSNVGDGWMGLGWNLNMQAISIGTKWGVPTFGDKNGDTDHDDEGEDIETEIYTLDNEQLMYPMREVDGRQVDWMPNRHFDVSDSVFSTQDLPRITEDKALFTLRISQKYNAWETPPRHTTGKLLLRTAPSTGMAAKRRRTSPMLWRS